MTRKMIPFDDVIMDEVYSDYLSKLGSKLILFSKLAPDVFFSQPSYANKFQQNLLICTGFICPFKWFNVPGWFLIWYVYD